MLSTPHAHYQCKCCCGDFSSDSFYYVRLQAVAAAPLPGDPAVAQHSCGALDVVCRHCAALHFAGERRQNGGFTECCAQGKVALEPLGPTPPLLEALLTGDDADSRNFRDSIRHYNSALAMASFVAQVEAPPGKQAFSAVKGCG